MKKISISFLNIIFSLVGSVLAYSFSLIFIRLFGLKVYGSYSLLTTYATLFSLVMSIGLGNLIIRDSYIRKNIKIRNIKEILKITSVIYIVFICITSILKKEINYIFFKNENMYILFLIYIFVLLIKNIYYQYLVSEKKSHKKNFIEQILFKIIFIILIMIFYKLKLSMHVLLFFKFILEIICIFYLLRKNEILNKQKQKIKYLDKENIIYSWYLMLHQVTETGIFHIDKIIIGYYLTLNDVGGYNFTLALSGALMIVPGAIRSANITKFSEYMKNKNKKRLSFIYKKTQVNMVYISLPIIITLSFFSKEILYFFNRELQNYSRVLLYLSLSSFSNILFGFNGTIINMSKYYKVQFYSKIIFIILIIISDINLIKIYGINGAALATFICFTLYNLIKTLIVLKKEGITPFSKENIRQIIGLIIIVLLISLIKKIIEFNIMSIILLGIIQYMILYILMSKEYKEILKGGKK